MELVVTICFGSTPKHLPWLSSPPSERMEFAITIDFGSTPSGLTGHPGSRTTFWLLTGLAACPGYCSG